MTTPTPTPTPTETKADKTAPLGDHDRVTMLSRHADGTPAQHNPEIIGDKDDAIAAAKAQLSQLAVSGVDAELRAPKIERPNEADQDPGIAELKKAHDEAAAKAEKSAEAEINALVKDGNA